jgi:DNA-binding XRE family transcriptional regulator
MINLRNLREQMGWSQEELAHRAGISSKTIQAHEYGIAKDVHMSIVAKVSSAFECATDDLFLPEDNGLRINLPPDPETLSSLETAKTERAVIQEMQFEDAALEMQTTALERLAEQVQIYGKKNRFGHKQLRDVVLVAGVLLEVAWDVTSNDEPSEITESRALELLEALK